MKNSKPDLLRATGLSLTAFSVYALFLSKAYVFEGLIRAMPIETGRWGYLFPGNYLLYGPLGLMFHTFLHALGAQTLAITSLQLMDAALGAAGLFVFYFLLRRLGGKGWESVVWSVILGSFMGYWLWSTEAEDYILSTFLLLLLFYTLVRFRDRKTDAVVVGALHGLAILGHIVNIVFAPVVLWFLIRRSGRKWGKPVASYAIGTTIVAGGAYAAVLAFLRKPASFQEAWSWFQGSAATGSGVLNLGTGYTLANFGAWLKTSLRILISTMPGQYHWPAPWSNADVFVYVAGLLLLVFLSILVINLRRLYQKSPEVVGGCGLWLLMYALVFVRWQPYTGVYRVSDLVPLCVLLFLGYREFKGPHPTIRLAAGALALCLVIANGTAEIIPRSAASNNPHLVRMDFLKANTQEGDWITGDSGQDEIYIPYFAQRQPIVLGRYSANLDELARFIDGLLVRGQRVFVTSRVMDLPAWNNFFRRYAVTVSARDGANTLFRVTRGRK